MSKDLFSLVVSKHFSWNNLGELDDVSTVKLHCYTFQLKYVFWLEESVSRALGQSSLTP